MFIHASVHVQYVCKNDTGFIQSIYDHMWLNSGLFFPKVRNLTLAFQAAESIGIKPSLVSLNTHTHTHTDGGREKECKKYEPQPREWTQ